MARQYCCSEWSIALLLLAFVGSASAGTALDQANPYDGFEYLNDTFEWAQVVTDGVAGVLAGVELFTTGGTDTVSVSVGLADAVPFTTIATIGPGGTVIDTSSNIVLTVGEQFIIDVSGGTAPFALAGSKSNYSGGDLYTILGGPLDFSALFGPGSLAFETFITTADSAVPEPGSVVLMGG